MTAILVSEPKANVECINRPVTQTQKCTGPISHNAPVYNRNVHTSVAKTYIVGYFSDELWNVWHSSINSPFYTLAALANKKITKEWQPNWTDKMLSRGSNEHALWHMYSVWISTMFSLWNFISNVSGPKRPVCLLCNSKKKFLTVKYFVLPYFP